MKPKNGRRILRNRTLTDKDINAASVGSCLSKKPSKNQKSDFSGKENVETHYPQLSSVFSEEADLTAILEQNFDERADTRLTTDNLDTLQNELIKREIEDYSCDHFLCSIENRRHMSLRLWFLFELELIEDDESNYRNVCYHNQVYKGVDPNWKMEDLLQNQTVPAGWEFFPIQQLIIPRIEVVEEANVSNIENLHVDVGNLDDNGIEKILPTFLSKRNLRSVFDQTPLKTSKLLSTDSPTDSPTDSNDLQKVLAAQDEKKCTLLKKLSFIGGMDIPRLPGK